MIILCFSLCSILIFCIDPLNVETNTATLTKPVLFILLRKYLFGWQNLQRSSNEAHPVTK